MSEDDWRYKPLKDELEVGDYVRATKSISRVDQKAVIRKGDYAKVLRARRISSSDPQIVDIAAEGGFPLCDIVCFRGGPVRKVKSYKETP